MVLSEIRPGQTARLGPHPVLEPEVLGELAAMRLLPGEAVTVLEVVGRSGPVVVRCAGGEFALGRRLAARLRAEVVLP